MGPVPDSLVLLHLFLLTSPPTPAPSLQTELSLQKEQLQLKIIEVEDEAEKWQKEKDRIKVSSLQASPVLCSDPQLSRLGGGRPWFLVEASGLHLHPTLVSSGFSHPLWHSHQFAFYVWARHPGGILPITLCSFYIIPANKDPRPTCPPTCLPMSSDVCSAYQTIQPANTWPFSFTCLPWFE